MLKDNMGWHVVTDQAEQNVAGKCIAKNVDRADILVERGSVTKGALSQYVKAFNSILGIK